MVLWVERKPYGTLEKPKQLTTSTPFWYKGAERLSWTFPKVPVLWSVYTPAYSGAGSRVVIVRTAKRETVLSMDSAGNVWNVSPRTRPADEWTIYEDLRRWLKQYKGWRERPRWQQMNLSLEWPSEPPALIQLQFRFDLERAA